MPVPFPILITIIVLRADSCCAFSDAFCNPSRGDNRMGDNKTCITSDLSVGFSFLSLSFRSFSFFFFSSPCLSSFDGAVVFYGGLLATSLRCKGEMVRTITFWNIKKGKVMQ